MKLVSLLAKAFVLTELAVFATAPGEKSKITGEQALRKLMEGNARFVSGKVAHPNQSTERRAEVLTGQNPFAVVVGCSDSRVPLEIIFDQGIGDLFVVRTAGQVMDNVTLGSIEYAVEHLGVPLVVVLGHDGCGAVKATIEGSEAKGHIGNLVEAIKSAVEKVKKESSEGQLLSLSIDENIRNIVSGLRSSEPILSEFVKEGKPKIFGARYHLDSGAVEIIE